MTPLGWIMMLVSNVTVVSLTAYCLYRVLMLPPVEVENLKAPLEIDTRDTKNPS